MTTHPDPKPMTDEQTKAGAVFKLPAIWRERAERKQQCGLMDEAVLDRAHADELERALESFSPQPPPEQAGSVVPKVVATAPERIWLQVCNEDDCEDCRDSEFPDSHECTWCADAIGGIEVEYVRADLSAAPAPKETP